MFSFLQNKVFLFVLALVNITAGIYSLSFYSSQLASSDFLFWIFIADCPVAAILFGLTVLLIALGIKVRWLSFLSIVASVKFSLWTIFVLILSGSIVSLWWVGLVHFLLLFELIVFFGLFDFRVKNVLLALVIFLIGDYFDYVLGTHPFVPKDIFVFAGLFAILSSLIFCFVLPLIFSSKIESSGVFFENSSSFVQVKRKGKWGV
jgi:uncharacterized membrane protein YpjA